MTMIKDVALYAPRLLEWRNYHAYSQAQLASLAHVAQATIVRLEQGYSARPSTIRKLAEALGCEPADLMYETEDGE